MANDYKPWRYANRDEYTAMRRRAFNNNAEIESEAAAQRQPSAADVFNEITAPRKRDKGGGGLLGTLKDAGKTALTVLDAPRKYVGAPAFALATGTTGNDVRVDPETGQTFRDAPDFGDVARGLKEALSRSPVKTYQEALTASQERSRDPNLSPVARTVMEGVQDPLNLLGPGLVKAGMKALPAGVRATRAARVGGALLETPGHAALGGIAGAAAGTAAAEAGDFGPVGTAAATIGGGLAGGVIGGNPRLVTAGARGLHDAAIKLDARINEPVPGGRGRPVTAGMAADRPGAGLVVRPGFTDLPLEDVHVRPELFQAKDVPAGSSFDEARVQDRMQNFKETDLTPGIVAYDTSTGEYVVLAGHHRREVFRRRAEQGLESGVRPWKVIEADLSDPDQLMAARALAARENYGAAKLNVREDIQAYKRLKESGADNKAIKSQMGGRKQQEIDDLEYLSHLPDDLIERLVTDPARINNAAEVGRAAKAYGLEERDIRALYGRYVSGEQAALPRTAVRDSVQAIGSEIKAKRATGGFPKDIMGDAGTEVLSQIDAIKAHERELSVARRQLKAAIKAFERYAGDERLGEHYAALQAAAEADVQRLTDELADIRRGYAESARRKWEGTAPGAVEPGAPAGGERVLETGMGTGARGAAGEPATSTTGAGGAPEVAPSVAAAPGVGEWVSVNGREGEVTAVRDGAIRLKGIDGAEEWVPTGPDMFGNETVIQPAVRPTEQGGLELQGGSKGVNPPPMNQGGLPGMPDAEPPPAAPVINAGENAPSSGPEVGAAPGAPPPAPTLPSELAGAKPRPPGEPPTVAIPEGSGRSIDELRAAAPPGYRLHVPAEGPPVYRRVLTQADIDWIAAHPERPPVTRADARGMFQGDDLEAVQDEIANRFAIYHPKWNSPTDTLRASFDAIKKAARARLNALNMREALADYGIDQSDLKAMGAEERRAFYRDVNQRTQGMLKDIETEVTRDEWWDGLVDSKGQGFAQGRPTGGIGGGIEQPTGVPPATPPRTPPVRQGATGTAPLDSNRGPVDLLGTRPKKEVVAEAKTRASKPLSQVVQRVKSALGRLESDTVRERVDPILREKNRVDNVIGHQVAWAVARERATLGQAGLTVEKGADGAWHLHADGRDVGLFEDVVERVNDGGRAGYESLSEAQRAALATIGDTNAAFNGTKHFHGAQVREDDNILGDYFGRRALSREYLSELTGATVVREKGKPANLPSRKVGANRTKSRTMESIEQGMEKGITYDNPWEARAAILRGKLLDAEDAYLKGNLKNLRVKKPGSTLGLEQVTGHPAFNNMWFEPDVARRIQKGLDSTVKGPLKTIEQINGVLTPLRASFDLSATLQQGMRMWLTDPKHAGEYWWEVVRSLKDPKVYDGMLLRLDADGPGLQYLLERGLRFTGEGVEGDFFFPEWMLNKVGKAGAVGEGANKAFTASNQHFGRLLNAYRVEMANSQYANLVAAGMSGKELDDAMRQSVDGINRSFGWTHSKPSTIEQALLFAPRYTRASLETVKAAISQGGIEGSLARKHLGLMMAEGAGLVWLLNEMRGYQTEFDPRDPNFLRLRNVAGLDVSPFGTYNTIIRATAQTVAGDPYGDGLPDPAAIGRFVEGKLSPAVSTVYWPVKGETYLGEPLDPTAGPKGFLDTAGEMAQTMVPFGAQNLFEPGLVPTKESVASALVGSTGLTNTPLSPTEKLNFERGGSPGGIHLPVLGDIPTTGRGRDGLAQELFGKPYDQLSGAEKAQVNERPEVQAAQAEADRNTLTRGEGERGMATKIRQQVASELASSAEYLANGRDAAGKPYTGNDFRKAYSDTMLRAAGARGLLKDYEGGDPTVNGWFKLYDQATMPNGQIDYDKLERLQADYEAAHPGVGDKVDKATGIRDNAAVRELREAKKLARAYYQIPAYRGMSTDEGEKAGQFLALASDLVATGRAHNRNHALALLRQFDAEGAQLAFRASRLGTNPERKRFRQANPLFARFYYDTIPAGEQAA